jgi:hypothetical protein
MVMTIRFAAVLVLAALVPSAGAYIHFPPPTLQKMCQHSHHIRLLKIAKVDGAKGVIVFEVAETFKGEKSRITSFTHVIRAGAEGAKPILDWAGNGKDGKDAKTAVLFAIESIPGGPVQSLGYVFIDDYCYSVDYNTEGKYWLIIRGEPDLSTCFHGPVKTLRRLVKDILAGKEVKVPVKKPATQEDREKRKEQINDVLKKNK